MLLVFVLLVVTIQDLLEQFDVVVPDLLEQLTSLVALDLDLPNHILEAGGVDELDVLCELLHGELFLAALYGVHHVIEPVDEVECLLAVGRNFVHEVPLVNTFSFFELDVAFKVLIKLFVFCSFILE